MNQIPILILHGWNLNSRKFEPLKRELIARGYPVHCPDLPGFGKSKMLKRSFTLSDYVNYVIDLLKTKRINKITLVGHSFGGRIAIKLAARYPELLHALVLTGTPGISPVPKVKVLIFLFLAKVGKLIFNFPQLRRFKNLFQRILYRLAGAMDYYHTDPKMRESFQNVTAEDLVAYMTEINIPTLILWGNNDAIIPVSIAEKMHKLIKGSKFKVISDARHGVPWTHPKLFVDAMAKFLSNL